MNIHVIVLLLLFTVSSSRLMKLLTTFLILTICLTTIGQTSPIKDDKIIDANIRWKIKDYKLPEVNSETESQGVVIQNSFPKGDAYKDSKGKVFGIGIFWTRIINLTAKPLELAMKFSADSLVIRQAPDSFLKLFLLPDTMTLDKVSLYGYGVTDLRSFLDTGIDKPTSLQIIINPKQECLFYVGVHYLKGGGVTRTGLISKEQDLFYRITNDLDSTLIPCGRITFKH